MWLVLSSPGSGAAEISQSDLVSFSIPRATAHWEAPRRSRAHTQHHSRILLRLAPSLRNAAPRAGAGGRAPAQSQNRGFVGYGGRVKGSTVTCSSVDGSLHYPTRRFQGVASLTRGCSAQAWEANSAESCVLNVRFISSNCSSAGGPEGLNTQAHSEQPHLSTFCPSIHTNSRGEFSW